MNLQAIEAIVRRLFSDEEFRARAFANPAEALSEYRLSAAENHALTKLCVQMADGQQLNAVGPMGMWT